MKESAVPEELNERQATPVGAGAAASSETPSTGRAAAPAGLRVSAVVVVRNGAAWLAECLDGIAAQDEPPSRLVIVDVASTDTSAAIAQAHARVRRVVPDVRILRLDASVPIGRAIDRGVAALPMGADPAADGQAEPEWVWVVHDDSAPRPTTLSRLVAAVRRSPSVGVAGPKIVDWDDTRRLVSLGIQVTRSGRRLASPARGEADQGQHDSRTDVLAVSTSGMLVRRDVHADLGGFDRSFEQFGADLDFGWRAHLAGHRVVVVPEATLREASAGLDGERPGGPGPARADRLVRRAYREVALARCAPLVAPFLAVWMVLSSVAAALFLLVAKRPRSAWRELQDVAALVHPGAILGARWRGRRTKRLRRSNLATLFVSPLTAARATVDHIWDGIAPERSWSRREMAPTTETGPAAEESESLGAWAPSLARRVVSHPGFLAVVASLASTVVAWRDAISAGALSPTHTGLAGGELRPVLTDSAGLWHSFRDAWHGAGLGSGVEAGPHLAVLSALTWLAERVPGVAESRSSAGVTVAWLLFTAPALATWTAYLAGRVVTRSRAPRAVVALAWGSAATLTVGVSGGRVTAAVGHVLLPLVLGGYALAARRSGTFTATFATSLAIAVLGAFVTPLLVVAAVVALVLLVVGPGSAARLRAFVLLVVPAGLLGPWVMRFVDDWRLLLSGPGLVSTDPESAPWHLVAGLPFGSAHGWLAWALVPVCVLGVLGYATRSRSRAESCGLAAGAVLAVIGLAGALAAALFVLGSAETGVGQSAPAHLWAGVPLDLWLAGVLVGVLAGSRAVRRLRASAGHRARVATGVGLMVLAVASVVGGAVSWALSGVGSTLTVGEATRPAVAAEQAQDPLSNRLLVLRPTDAVVDFVLAGREPGEMLRDLDRPPGADDRPLVDAVGRLAGGQTVDSSDASGLARWGIGFVQVRAGSDAPLVRRLDALEGLTRLGASEQGILWKVLPLRPAAGAAPVAAPSRARLVDQSGGVLSVIPTRGPHAAVEVRIAGGPEGRSVVLAEPVEWSYHAVVSLDGRILSPVKGQQQPTYAIPAGGGELRVDLAAATPWWRLCQASLLVFTLFMALPVGNRRSRRHRS